MTVGIIDDESANRLVIKSILNSNCSFVNITVEEGAIDKSVEQLNAKKPDLIFLDIELRNGTGFNIIEQLKYNPEIIFTTAYSQYAINAIKVRAFDYILKPINESELLKSINDCLEKLNRQQKVLREAKSPISEGFFNIASSNDGRLSLNYNDIFYFESSGSYTYCVTSTKKIIFSRNIGDVEKEVPKSVFYRTHNSYIVNLTKIVKIEMKRNGRLHLSNKDTIPLAQRKIKEFKSFFEMHKSKKP